MASAATAPAGRSRRQVSVCGTAASRVLSLEVEFADRLRRGDVARAFALLPEGPHGRVATQRANRMLVTSAGGFPPPTGANRATIYAKFVDRGGLPEWRRRRDCSEARAARMLDRHKTAALSRHVAHGDHVRRCWCRAEAPHVIVQRARGTRFDCPICLRDCIENEDYCKVVGCEHVMCVECMRRMPRVR